MLNDTPQLASGARGVVQITDSAGVLKTLAVALDINVNVRSSVRETYVMGELNPVSLDPTSIDVDCSFGRVIPISKQTSSAPIDKTNHVARSSGDAVNPTHAVEFNAEQLIQNTLTSNSIDIALYDTITNKYLATVKGARFSGRSLSTNTSDIANERLNFVGIWDAGYDNNQSANTGYES